MTLAASNASDPESDKGENGTKGLPGVSLVRTANREAPVVVLGAGPYGLSIAAHLQARGIRVRVFGEPMGSWRHRMPKGMFLKSEPSASTISAPRPGYGLADYCADQGLRRFGRHQPVPIDVFVRYGLWFADRLVTVEETPVEVVTQAGDGFEVALASGEQLHAPAVVVSTGLTGFANVPVELQVLAPNGPSPEGILAHSSQHPDLTRLAGRRVGVIGAGQSALETAVLAAERGADVTVIARRSNLVFASPPADAWARRLVSPSSPMGPGWSLFALSHGAGAVRHLPARARHYLVRSVLGPSGSWWLRPRLQQRLEVRTGEKVTGATRDADKARLSLVRDDGRHAELIVDHVIAATGYRVDIDAMSFLDPWLRAALRRTRSSPALDATFQSSVPGLYFAGLPAAATFGPLLRFVCGTGFNAVRLSEGVSARTRQPIPA
jgi:FAD-dependent urate hydroxylase